MRQKLMSGKAKFAVQGSFSELDSLVHRAGIRLKKQEKPVVPDPPAPLFSEPQDAPNKCSEEDLFLQAMGGVQRASWRRSPQSSSEPVAIAAGDDADMQARKLMESALEENSPMDILDHPEYIEGWMGGAGKRFLPKLRNGFYSIQGQIDLHGLSREKAQKDVEEYIIRMSRFHSCCIKIIHGRGINSPTDRATLKEDLQRLLCTRKMSRYVVAYASAQFNDGGVGAVYVLLSRQ
jgi:DNA-nicking Smr family endonuclease